ncbi:glycosyltransferase [Brevundimonas sp. SPF441]|uniref:glycosyltransferase n=1 Tax=Brevundimonas sp. SPF441 TaxID=2663795 RepID=UPI00129ED78A|nr:glycosyltransferase [Brevundimonas sp. SPF441]MRL69663.1 glycosyltransferase [Brevundimonas sp. SPF441]
MSDWRGGVRRYFRELRKPRPASDKAWARRLDLTARAELKAGNIARDAGRWEEAAGHYAAHLRLKPDAHAIHVQHGNMLMELGELHLAEAAFRLSLQAHETAGAYVQLAMNLSTQGRREIALQSLAHAHSLEPRSSEVATAFDILRNRTQWPSRRALGLDSADDSQLSSERALWLLRDYDVFRRHVPTPPAPVKSPAKVHVWIDAVNAGPAKLRVTIRSLQQQDHQDWQATIFGAPELIDHPVGSLIVADERFSTGGRITSEERISTPLVLLSAGLALDPNALSWLIFALERTNSDVAYSDHEYGFFDWRDGLARRDPVLFAEADPIDIQTTGYPPEIVILAPSTTLSGLDDRLGEVRRNLVRDATTRGGAAHIPLFLGAVMEVQIEVDATPKVVVPSAWKCAVVGTDNEEAERGRIQVIIPTRNESAMLSACVESLLTKAADPEDLSFIIIDNRSDEPAMSALLENLTGRGHEILKMDEPFNWARFNNHAAHGRDGVLLFANNDLEMLTQDWDALLKDHLRRQCAGVVGARLVYADRTIQHGGIAFGGGESGLTHEGVGAPKEAVGPLQRWTRARGAAAVTGAFMAVSSEVFQRAGGFNESLAVAYNDVDFCMRVRALGLMAIYAGDIEAIHFESRSRGRNDTPVKISWDLLERHEIFKDWGRELLHDPSRNPNWRGVDANPFLGLAQPSLPEILRHIDRSARPRSWTVAAPSFG